MEPAQRLAEGLLHALHLLVDAALQLPLEPLAVVHHHVLDARLEPHELQLHGQHSVGGGAGAAVRHDVGAQQLDGAQAAGEHGQ